MLPYLQWVEEVLSRFKDLLPVQDPAVWATSTSIWLIDCFIAIYRLYLCVNQPIAARSMALEDYFPATAAKSVRQLQPKKWNQPTRMVKLQDLPTAPQLMEDPSTQKRRR